MPQVGDSIPAEMVREMEQRIAERKAEALCEQFPAHRNDRRVLRHSEIVSHGEAVISQWNNNGWEG